MFGPYNRPSSQGMHLSDFWPVLCNRSTVWVVVIRYGVRMERTSVRKGSRAPVLTSAPCRAVVSQTTVDVDASHRQNVELGLVARCKIQYVWIRRRSGRSTRQSGITGREIRRRRQEGSSHWSWLRNAGELRCPTGNCSTTRGMRQ